MSFHNFKDQKALKGYNKTSQFYLTSQLFIPSAFYVNINGEELIKGERFDEQLLKIAII